MATNDPALNCILKQVLALKDGHPITNFAITLIDDDPFHYQATILGPLDSPFEGGIYRLRMRFDHRYPFKPPQVNFVTKIFHPNISLDGKICMDILYNGWCPILSIEGILLSIQSMFASPDILASFPVNNEAANLYMENRAQYEEHVRWYTKTYAV